MDYFGPLNDPFYAWIGFRDDCGMACAAAPTIVPSRFDGGNTISRVIGNGYETFSPNIYFDCDNNTVRTPGGCENYNIQNLTIAAWVTADVTTSNESPILESDINIYPNPAADEIQINFESLAGDASISIFDINGRIMYEESVEGQGNYHRQVQINNWAKGVYLVKIESGDSFEVRKFQVQ